MSKTIYALGFFDGVHIGHTQLLLACHSLAFQHEAKAGVVTFGSHPEALVQGNAPRPQPLQGTAEFSKTSATPQSKPPPLICSPEQVIVNV